ncbi:NADH dehydrogenase subunit L [Thermoflavifilum aggregans]|uniref:NADH dehydrogenase subunit L n=1 Tax=Thermoflavifilum aggregans TaxID=454188 RepID=A0A2M9CSQ2_9BACT|nr:NADH-quinone oxidoreductase subunit L [Thermoflavifilum aggregans]PJJ74970.1 NADH dehydrogenase subunit L [Thermoflavifilum aggregans]
MDVFHLLWLVPAFPLAGFLILALFGLRLHSRAVAWIGTGSIGLSAILTLWIGIHFLTQPPANYQYSLTLWTWFDINGFAPGIALYLDPLSLVYIFVITFVSFFIHLYSTAFMRGDEGYVRFFAYMNLFVFSMLVLVLANNLLLLYLGWEGVGLCSFLLIGFWYRDEVNGYAARKAFIVTRIGDTAFIIGLFLLVKQFHTLNIQDILQQAPVVGSAGAAAVVWVTILLLGGAVGKSAQLPLQTWLPDAMAGPTPVSALIHAATMVTAGVYLIARTHVLYSLAPAVQSLVAIIGLLTLLIAGFSALAQHDLKRILAYSTISQIGYMFLALGVGAWTAAIFHFMIHAFFKALLFLAAGAVIMAMEEEHDIFKMGGLRKKMPITFWTFLAGSGALAAIPLITAGFYSKDQILFDALASTQGSFWLWLGGFVGAFITVLYTFRMVYVTFYGEQKKPITHNPEEEKVMMIPLIVLAVLSIIAGWIELPHAWAHFTPFSDFLTHVLPPTNLKPGMESQEFMLQLLTAVIVFAGIYLTWLAYVKKPALSASWKNTALGRACHDFFYKGWMFDQLYDTLFVKPVVWISRIDPHDFIDYIYEGFGRLNVSIHAGFSRTQSGYVRWYLLCIAIGILFIFSLILFV